MSHPRSRPSAKSLPRRRQPRITILMRARKDNQEHSEPTMPGCAA